MKVKMMIKKIFDSLEQYYFPTILSFIFFMALFFIFTKYFSEPSEYHIVKYDKFKKLEMSTLNKIVIDISTKEKITNIDLYPSSLWFKKDIISFTDDLEINCSYQFKNNEWYIKKQGIKTCTKDEAINNIGHFIETINKNVKEQKNIEKSWEK